MKRAALHGTWSGRCVCITLSGCLTVTMMSSPVIGFEINNVMPMSLDLPRLNIILSPTSNPTDALIFTDALDEPVQTFTAFADTGASGLLLDGSIMASLINYASNPDLLQRVNGNVVQFYDVGVGGSEAFDVSAAFFVGVANNPLTGDPNSSQVDPASFVMTPVMHRLQVSHTGGASATFGSNPLNVFGMPILAGKVLVIDNRPINAAAPLVSNLGDLLAAALAGEDLIGGGGGSTLDLALHTRLHQPGDSAIPTTNRHVQLTYASFEPFTFIDPDEAQGAQRPAMEANPFVGWNPIVGKQTGDPAGVTVQRHGQSDEGSFLLDTGASISMISSQIAQTLGVLVTPDGLVNADTGELIAGQFNTTIGGVGGSKKVYGFVVDALTLPTVEGEPIRFINAPVYVADISVQRTLAGGDTQVITLDGILGMNLLSAGANVNSDVLGFDPSDFMSTINQTEWDLMNDPTGDPLLLLESAFAGGALLELINAFMNGIPTSASPIEWLVIDNQAGVMGLQIVPEPMSLGTVLVLGGGMLLRRKRAGV